MSVRDFLNGARLKCRREIGMSAGAKSKPAGSKTARSVSPARRAAFHFLRRVEEENAYASVLLAASDEEMRAEDRALCHELVLGVLRWQLWLDSLIEHYAGAALKAWTLPCGVPCGWAYISYAFSHAFPLRQSLTSLSIWLICLACARLPLSLTLSCGAPRASLITILRAASRTPSNGWR